MQIATTPQIEEMLRRNEPAAIGVSGGKDSCAVAFAVTEHLDEIGHRGPRILIHADLGVVEWKDSGPSCARLADRLGLELVTVSRAAGDMMERWEGRWENNVARYVDLECVKLILPWSTASLRFCTSELKVDPICAALVKKYPNSRILSVSGIRRDESRKRAKAPVMKQQPKLTSRKWKTEGYTWNALLEWKLEEVFSYLKSRDFELHEAYRTYGSSRVSCSFCILASQADLKAASTCPDNADIYRRMVDLEIVSAFAFQEGKWLGDVRPGWLSQSQMKGLARAKKTCSAREEVEARIPEHLLYTKGWPTCIPRLDEARLLCSVREAVADLMGFSINFQEPEELVARYEELMEEAAQS